MATLSRTFAFNPRRLAVWLPALIWMTVIFFLSSRQRIAVSEEYWLNFAFFKSLHVGEYAFLTLLYAWALWRSFHSLSRKQIANGAALLAILYAASDELHQTFVPTRQGHLQDVLIDCIGIFSVYCFIVWYETYSHFFPSCFRSRKTQ